MKVRNWLFDISLICSQGFDIPIISVGNLSVGGTGKTPHIEYLIRLLKDRFSVATLSRGYKRDSTGFVLASKKSNYKYIGDEPMQFVRKFSDIKVAVDADRRRGIASLKQKFPSLDVILLDDAYQHRYVRPGLSILLTDYMNPYTEDHVVPSGTLREFREGARRANVIVVTKTPKVFSPITRRRLLDELKPASHQQVLFSYIRYGDPVPACPGTTRTHPPKYSYILLFTGIANDYPLREHLERQCSELICLKYPDHHAYTVHDLETIRKTFEDIPSQKKVIYTTEKDYMRLKTPELSNILQTLPLFYIPMEVDFHGSDRELFDHIILNYVAKNSGHRRVPGG